MEDERLDKLLIQRKLADTRVRAEKIIRETGVKVNGKLVTKTGKRFPSNCVIEMITEEIPWVSKRAFKLLEALAKWSPEIKNATLIDVGASEGGFSEVLLKNGAKKIFAIDDRSKQLHPTIEEDTRVINLEKMHVRELTPAIINELCDGCVIDINSISLEKIFPFVHSFIRPDGFVIALVKPQFEVGKNNTGKGGVVKNKKLYKSVIEDIKSSALLNNLSYVDHVESPILSSDGNREFLMLLNRVAN